MKNSTPLVLLPGSLCNEKLFAPQVAFFSQQRRVIVSDLTGDGTIEAMAAHVLSNAPESFALAGLSMGGIVAFEILRQAPERVERLALLDTNPEAEMPHSRERRIAEIAAIKAGGSMALQALIGNDYFPYYVAVCHLDNQFLKQVVLDMAKETGETAFVNQWQALMNRPVSGSGLSNIACKTLVLCGGEDALCRPEIHREMASKIPDSELRIIKNCGHLSTLEAPDEVNQALDSWLNN